MKSLTLAAGMALACGLALSAKAATEHHLTGCLQKGSEPNAFKLTNVTSAKGPKEWELVGAPADLKLSDHVGHKVEVTGMMVGMREAEKLEGEAKPTKAEQREEAKEHHFKVTGLKHVSPT